ncbi:EamA/RhaT family transporter [Pseudoxanthomonas putridarboris]|uniref:EamA/RhaT family transporter n=1 Tax=Pseudoxanthomonas putridarboris TaxID=752605 RepID=A0ABU9IWR0_9GAMM
MPFLIVSVLCSVLVSVVLKLAYGRGIDVPQIITWNYLAALLLCLGLLDPPLAALHDPGTPIASLVLLALLLPGIFLAMAASVRVAGIVRTDVAQRLSLMVSLAAAFLFFGETADGLKLAGLGLGLLAIAGIVARDGGSGPERASRSSRWLLPLTVLLGYAGVDILLKRIAMSGTPFAASLLFAFAGAFAVMCLWQLWRIARRGVRPTLPALSAGLLVGASNFGNILFYVKAHRALPDNPAVVFATMNLGVVVLGTLVGTLGFGEKLGRLNKLGIALALVAVVLIAISRQG